MAATLEEEEEDERRAHAVNVRFERVKKPLFVRGFGTVLETGVCVCVCVCVCARCVHACAVI